MVESIVINLDSDLLMNVLTHSKKKGLNIARYISEILRAHIDFDEGKTKCPYLPSGGLCLNSIPIDASLPGSMQNFEKLMIKRALANSDMVQSKAANLLGIGRSGLHQKIQKYNL